MTIPTHPSPDAYFDTRHLTALPVGGVACPVRDRHRALSEVPSQWGNLPYCSEHGIRIHSGSSTFVYYNGADQAARTAAAMRNIRFEREFFRNNILGHAAKAETHRICNETSEDALTWNVLSAMARAGTLREALSSITGVVLKSEPELYLWGLPIRLDDSSKPTTFAPLLRARATFENGIKKFLTEPDIMLLVPGQLLTLIEAKFTSGNTVAKATATDANASEKPKSRSGIIARYSSAHLPGSSLVPDSDSGPFYSQLYRNLVFAIHMANQLNVDWSLLSLVSESQCRKREAIDEYKDPTPFIRSVLPEEYRRRFQAYSWERLYTDHVSVSPHLRQLADYIENKSAHCQRAFDIYSQASSNGAMRERLETGST